MVFFMLSCAEGATTIPAEPPVLWTMVPCSRERLGEYTCKPAAPEVWVAWFSAMTVLIKEPLAPTVTKPPPLPAVLL